MNVDEQAVIPSTPARRAADIAVLVIAAFCLLSRNPARLFQAQLWAEDGQWYHDAYTFGWPSLLLAHTGYLQTLPRFVALCAALLPATVAPTLFAIAGFAVQLVPLALLLTRRAAALIPSLQARLLLIAFYVAVPNSAETFVNLTDAQWHLAIMMFLLIVLPPPLCFGQIPQAAALLIGGLSGPFSILLAPFAWWETLGANWRKSRIVTALIVTLCAAVQAGFIIAQATAHRSPAPLGASLPAFARIVVGQIFIGGLVGIKTIIRVAQTPLWQCDNFMILILAVCLPLMLAALLRGPGLARKFLLYAALILITALASPVASGTTPQWQVLEVPSAGSRYYLLPILAWFTAILVLSADRNPGLRWPARLLLPVFLVGAITDWRYPSLLPTQYQQAANRFDTAVPGTKVIFPEDPDPTVWVFSLTKR